MAARSSPTKGEPMDDEALPIRPRFLVIACAGAMAIFAVSAVVAWKQVIRLGNPSAAGEAEAAPGARTPVVAAALPRVMGDPPSPAPSSVSYAPLTMLHQPAVLALPGAAPAEAPSFLEPAVLASAPENPPLILAQARLPPADPAQTPAPAPALGPSQLFRICAGSPTGNYTFAAREIAGHLTGLGEAEVIATAGSGENLRRLAAGECEMGFSQADVLALRTIEHPDQVAGLDPFKRIYGEYAHILCPVASGWTNASGFDGRTRLILGGEGSGTAETWRAFTRASPALSAVQRVNDPVNLVAVNRVKDSRDTCMLWISGLNSGDMQGANRMSANTADGRRAMRLVGVTSPELRSLRLADGQPIYRFEQIDTRSGAYENLLDPRTPPARDGRRSNQTGSVTVPVVDAVLVVRRDFLGRLPGRGSEIVAAVEDASPAIWARVSPKR